MPEQIILNHIRQPRFIICAKKQRNFNDQAGEADKNLKPEAKNIKVENTCSHLL